MEQCLKISLLIGSVGNGSILAKNRQGEQFLNNFVLKHARKLNLEGVGQFISDNHVRILVCGLKEKIEDFVDLLYRGSEKYKIDDIQLESFVKERNFRGIFRVIF